MSRNIVGDKKVINENVVWYVCGMCVGESDKFFPQ
jgi:hypothetical protein